MLSPTIIIILIVIAFGIAGFLVYIGLREFKGVDPLEERLAEFRLVESDPSITVIPHPNVAVWAVV